jgi:hypothetical protein
MHHDIAELDCAANYVRKIVSAGERSEPAPGENVELKTFGSDEGLAGQEKPRPRNIQVCGLPRTRTIAI